MTDALEALRSLRHSGPDQVFRDVYWRVIKRLFFYYFHETMNEFVRDEPSEARQGQLASETAEKWQHNI